MYVLDGTVKIERYTDNLYSNTQWTYLNKYLINTATGNVLTGSTDKISVAPQQGEDDSQQWILDYNGKTLFNNSFNLYL